MLQEVKATKDGKCSKCNRDIRKTWTIFYDTDSKQIYCKPCGSTLEQSSSNSTDLPDDTALLINEAVGNSKVTIELLGALNLQMTGLGESIRELKKSLETSLDKLSKKK